MPLPSTTNAIQRYFIEELTRNGLDEVGPEGIEKLRQFVSDNEIDGFEVRPRRGSGISQAETDALNELIRSNELRAFLTVDGRRALESQLNLRQAIYGGLSGREVAMPEGTLTRIDLSRVGTQRLAAAFASEVEDRGDIFRNPGVSVEEKGEKLYLLFKDYATELNKAERRSSAQGRARRALLGTLDRIPAAKVFLLQDSDGDSFNNATELVFGTRPGKPENEFPFRRTSWSTYQSMQGTFYAIAEKIDRVLRGMNLPAEVAAHERRSAVAWLMGERPGNTITTSLEESRAISSTAGLDFVKGLFSPTDRVAKLELVDGFDIAVDFLNPSGGFVSFDRSAGDRMQAIEKSTGAVLRARIEEVPVNSEPLPRYRPIFSRASGEVVPEGEVKLVIMDQSGRVKGDGRAEGAHRTSWWGFCDRNSLSQLVTTRYGYPRPEQSVSIEAGGDLITFTPDEILDIVGRRMTELFASYDYTGVRFDDVLSQITLKDGTSLLGRLREAIGTAGPDVVSDGDMVTLSAKDGEDPFGRPVVRITRKEGDGPNAPTKFEATGPQGDRFEVRPEDIPGGFRATASRPIAWRVSAAETRAIADLMLPVAQRIYRPVMEPAADVLRAYVTGILDALATSPDLDVQGAIDGDSSASEHLSAWARELSGASERSQRFVAAFAEMRHIHAHQAEPARAAALAACAARDAYARQALKRTRNLAVALRTDLMVDTGAIVSMGEPELRTKLFEWYDPADAVKVARLEAAIAAVELANEPELLFRTLSRDEILTGVESARATLETTLEAEYRSSIEQLRARIARIDTVSLREDRGYDDAGSPRAVTVYLFRVAPGEGEDPPEPRTYSVSERCLDFDGVSLWGRGEGSLELERLRRAVLAATEALLARATATKSEEDMIFPAATTLPRTLEVALSDGTTRRIRSDEIQTLVREEANDVAFEALIAHVKRHDGVTNSDSWMSEGISNGLHIFSSVRDYSATDRDAPAWIAAMKDKPLFGQRGEVKDRDRVRFYDLGYEVDGAWSSGTRGWIEFDRNNNPVNSSVILGMHDFLWSVEGKPDWSSRPTFNPHVPNDLVLRLYVRSVKDQSKLEALANDGLLPANWRDSLA